MAQNGTEKPLNAKQAKAALLLAEDDLSDEAIADQVGIGRTTLARWKLLPEVQHAIAEHVAAVERAMLRLAIAKRHKRVAVLDELHAKALAVIDERAVALAGMAPGSGTGLIVRDLKGVGAGKAAQVVEVFAVDTSLMQEIRALEEQAAKELGQWVEKSEQSGQLTNKIELVGVAEGDI